jgi:hypothetical protein
MPVAKVCWYESPELINLESTSKFIIEMPESSPIVHVELLQEPYPTRVKLWVIVKQGDRFAKRTFYIMRDNAEYNEGGATQKQYLASFPLTDTYHGHLFEEVSNVRRV